MNASMMKAIMFPAEPALDVLFTELVNPTTSCLLSKAALYKGALPVFPSLSVDCGDFPVFAFLYPPIPFPQQPIMRGRTHTHTHIFVVFFYVNASNILPNKVMRVGGLGKICFSILTRTAIIHPQEI